MPYPALLGEGGVFTYATRDAINALISSQGIISQGNVWWVKPISGSDANLGNSPAAAFQTLTAALAAATANQNDVVLLCAEGNAAANTLHINGLLDWNKDQVHLLGINAGPLFSQRSRIAFVSTYAAATDLFKLSANGCLISGIEFFMGVASALPTGCMTVTGIRNVIRKCHIAGMGNANNDISGAYSLNLKGAEECLFEDCTIGQDTVQLGAGTSNQVLNFTSASPANTRNWFRGCRFLLNTSSATVCVFVRGGGAGNIDRETVFEDCLFINAIGSGSTTMTYAMAVVTGGGILIFTGSKTGLIGASKWNATATVLWQTGGNNSTGVTGWGLGANIT